MSEEMMPPTKGGKRVRKPKEEKSVEVSLDEAVAEEGAEPSEKKPRAERKDYGYNKNAIVVIVANEKSAAYRGQRKDWFDTLVSFDGQTVGEWEASRQGILNNKGTPQAPRGWLRFYVVDGTVTLSAPAVEAEAA